MPNIMLPVLSSGGPIPPDILYYSCYGPYIGNHSVETCFQRHPAELGLTYNPPPPTSPIAVTLVDPIYKEVTASSLYVYQDRGDDGGSPREPL